MILNGRFEIKEHFDQGGIGAILKAEDLQNGREQVAVKILLEQKNASTREWVEKHFYKESEALNKIDHPSVVKLIDSGHLEDGRPFFVMEYVKGGNLRAELDPARGLKGDFTRAARLIKQLGEAITAAHKAGIYHRDLKPENIMLAQREDGSEQAKVIDFGIATVKESYDETTKATVFAGSLLYMSPEQISGLPTAASDIYALGAIAYEMTTGKTPFNPDREGFAQQIVQLMEMQRAGMPIKPSSLRPSLPRTAEDAILKALAYNPEDRYGQAEEFGNELAKALIEDDATKMATAAPTMEIAHVIFMDIVGYSKLPMDLQKQYIEELKNIVCNTPSFRQAQANKNLISLPTGDGMALAFFIDPLAAVNCAVETAQALKKAAHIKLRMGINSGPVYRVADINANMNVAGGGINIAQRVMDCGDEEHILLSKNLSDILLELSEWQGKLIDLGVQKVKHDARVHIYSLSNGEVGNAELPKKIRESRPVEKKRGKKAYIAAATAVLLIASAIGIIGIINKNSYGGNNQVNNPSKLRGLFYWAMLQRYDEKQEPIGNPIRLNSITGQTYGNKGDGITLHFISEENGCLYVFNESMPDESRTTAEKKESSYSILFPTPNANNGESRVREGEEAAAVEGLFDEQSATERIWIIWTAKGESELEQIIKRARDGEVVGADAKRLRGYIKARESREVKAEAEKEKKMMRLRFDGDSMVYSMEIAYVGN